MPILPDDGPQIATLCSLREALLWMVSETIPADTPDGIQPQVIVEQYPRRFAALHTAWRDGRLPLYGRPGLGAPITLYDPFDNFQGFDFPEYGDWTLIPVERLQATNPSHFDLDSSSIQVVESGFQQRHGLRSTGQVNAAWRYVAVCMATADLLSLFPPADGRAIKVPEPDHRPGGEAWHIEAKDQPCAVGNAPYDDTAVVKRAEELRQTGGAKSAREAARMAVAEAMAEGSGKILGASVGSWEERIRTKMRQTRGNG